MIKRIRQARKYGVGMWASRSTRVDSRRRGAALRCRPPRCLRCRCPLPPPARRAKPALPAFFPRVPHEMTQLMSDGTRLRSGMRIQLSDWRFSRSDGPTDRRRFHSETHARPHSILAAKSRNPQDKTEDRFSRTFPIRPHRFSRLVRPPTSSKLRRGPRFLLRRSPVKPHRNDGQD